MYVRGSAVN